MSLPQSDSTGAVAPAAEVASVSTSAEVADAPAEEATEENASSMVTCGQPSCWNMIAVPLVDNSLATAQDVLNYVVSFCDPACTGAATQAMYWNAGTQTFVTHNNNAPFPPPFAVDTGDAVFININNTYNASTFTFVGDVTPKCVDDAANCVQYDFSAPSTGWHLIMLPLEKSTITTAELLLDDIDATGATQA
ncbi:MAG TPA: hypothetical protein VLL52_14675, partial [Anaerolineae bacterium]|nr:hypothetical protein [Anaerolineae bacterium]